MDSKKKEYEISCVKCKTVYSVAEHSCPSCGCKLVRIVLKDGRDPFEFDRRRVQPR